MDINHEVSDAFTSEDSRNVSTSSNFIGVCISEDAGPPMMDVRKAMYSSVHTLGSTMPVSISLDL